MNVLLTDYAWPDLKIEREILREVGAELYMYVDVREISDRTVPVQTLTYSNNYMSEVTSDGLLRVAHTLRQALAETFQGDAPGVYNFEIVARVDGSIVARESDSITVTGGEPIPEPATLLLLGTGLVGAARFRRRR